MSINHQRPMVGVLACRKEVSQLTSHTVAEKYLLSLIKVAGVTPVSIPSLADLSDVKTMLARLDGLLLPGSVSNIEPVHYNGPDCDECGPTDSHRDGTTFDLIRAAMELHIPMIGICRGCQEINVALGGTLFQQLHLMDGYLDHREPAEKTLEEQFSLVHEVQLTPGGLLHRLHGQDRVLVNSLHGQGLDKIASGLMVEARAPDGLVEAIRLESARHFVLGVQWHPEWRAWENPFFTKIFAAFGDACRGHLRESKESA